MLFTIKNNCLKIKVLTFILITSSVFLFGQKLQEADSLFQSGDFVKAEKLYAQLLKNNPYDSRLNYKWGSCLLKVNLPQKAIEPLQRAARKYPEANSCLGDAYLMEYRFYDALEVYNKLLKSSEVDSIVVSIYVKIERANAAIRMLTVVEDIEIFDSIQVAKKDFFTYYQLQGNDAGEIYSVVKADSVNKIQTTGFLSPRKDRRIYADTINGDVDIFTSFKLFDGWSKKQELSEIINTSAKENFPFIRSDGITMYFSSDRNESIGGYDIFVARYNNENNDYMLPQNVGMPFNSPYNDYLLVFDDENDIAWFATDRYQHCDSVIIYQFKPANKRSYVESSDSSSLIKAAQLKTYRSFSESVPELVELESVPITKASVIKSMHFIVNDSTAYSSVKQFLSEEAKNSYKVGVIMKDKVEEKQFALELLRNKYALLRNESDKKNMISNIRSLEIECAKLKDLPNDYFKKARNLEIKELMQSK